MKVKVMFFQCSSEKEPSVAEQAEKELTGWLATLPKVTIVKIMQSMASPLRADKLVITILYTEG